MKRIATVLALGVLLACPLALGSGADDAFAMDTIPLNEVIVFVNIGGEDIPFLNIDGLGTETEALEVRPEESSEILKRPGRTVWSNITLERGVVDTVDLTVWRSSIEEGVVDMRPMSIRIEDQQGNILAVWNFENAWPVKVTGPFPRSDGNRVALYEKYTFAVDRGTRGTTTR